MTRLKLAIFLLISALLALFSFFLINKFYSKDSTVNPLNQHLPVFKKPEVAVNIVFFESKRNSDYKNLAENVIEHVRSLGIKQVSLVFFFFQEEITSTDLYRDEKRTLTDQEIREIIRIAKSKNLTVQLRPFLGIKKTFETPQSNQGRWNIEPQNSETWFKNYLNILTHYAQLAQEENVEVFGIGSEMKSQAFEKQKWHELIDKVRKAYQGQIIYAGNWDEFTTGGPFEKDLSWLSKVDIIGIDAYFPLEVSSSPSQDQLVAAWGKWQFVFDHLKKSGKQVIISEIGITAAKEHFDEPWVSSHDSSDILSQEKYYKAFLQFFKGKVDNIFIWAIDGYQTGDAGGFSPIGRPAENVIRSWTKSSN